MSKSIFSYTPKEDFIQLKSKMTTQATNIIAGNTIGKEDFPHKFTLPRFNPLPFNNFGHFYLFLNIGQKPERTLGSIFN